MRRHHPIVLAGAFLMLPAAADAQQIPEALYRSDTPLVLEWETTAVFRNRSPIIL